MSYDKKKNKIRQLTYFALCQNLLDFIDGGWIGHPANKQSVKSATNHLIKELERANKTLFPPEKSGDELLQALDTFQNACTAMESFFILGMEMDTMDKIHKDSLNTQINILLKSYGVDCWEKPMSNLWK
jgi:hypothetical protein